jgi:hypothetical protein
MIRLFQSVINRVKAMFTLDAMLDLEQQFVTRQAERKAELLRTADRYQQEGLTAIAADLRRQAETLSEQRPLQTVLPFLESEPETRSTSAVSRTMADGRDRRGKRLQLPKPVTTSGNRKKGK